MALPIYSSKEVKINWAGASITGLASDSFVSFSYNSDLTDEKIGADGLVEISVNPDSSGTCSLTLLQEGEGNYVMSGALHALKTFGKVVQGTLTISDPSGSVLAVLRKAHLKTGPEMALGSTTQERTWTFFVEQMVFASVPTDIAKNMPDDDALRIAAGIDTLKNSFL